jgi:hypothetical protein
MYSDQVVRSLVSDGVGEVRTDSEQRQFVRALREATDPERVRGGARFAVTLGFAGRSALRPRPAPALPVPSSVR